MELFLEKDGEKLLVLSKKTRKSWSFYTLGKWLFNENHGFIITLNGEKRFYTEELKWFQAIIRIFNLRNNTIK